MKSKKLKNNKTTTQPVRSPESIDEGDGLEVDYSSISPPPIDIFDEPIEPSKTVFDPFKATCEEALLRDDEWASKYGIEYYDWHMVRQSAAGQVNQLRETITEKEDGFAVLAAIRLCACYDLIMPRWLSDAYIKRYDAVLSCRSGSWDDAFGKPYPRKHLGKLRQRRMLRPAVGNRIFNIMLQEPNTPIDKGLFERVGEEFGIGATFTEELYREFYQWFPPRRRKRRREN